MKAGFALPVEMADEIEQALVRLRRMTEAECVLLADVSGQLISLHGQMDQTDPVLVAALAAGDVAAMSELSRQIGEENPSGAFLHEGEHKSIYLNNVAGSLILIVIFGSDVPVGLVRLFAGRAAEELLQVTGQFEDLITTPTGSATSDFSAALSDELEKAFNGMI
jgi:predicted regulator of Ras-like GTPase activity (Roadblock/LC7/MglB family)